MKPNILMMIADDATYNDLSLYGGQNVETPNIDRLARQGLVFNRAYLPMAMCNPCRTALYTGLHPARNGSCWNHSAARPGHQKPAPLPRRPRLSGGPVRQKARRAAQLFSI